MPDVLEAKSFVIYIYCRRDEELGEQAVWRRQVSSPSEFSSLQEMIEKYEEGEDVISVVSEEEYLKRKKKEERKEVEECAAELLKKRKLKEVDSVEFFNALDEELEAVEEEENEKIQGFMEDGLCNGFGITSEQYSMEMNSLCADRDSRLSRLRKLKKFLNETFPIVSAMYRQSKLSDKNLEHG